MRQWQCWLVVAMVTMIMVDGNGVVENYMNGMHRHAHAHLQTNKRTRTYTSYTHTENEKHTTPHYTIHFAVLSLNG